MLRNLASLLKEVPGPIAKLPLSFKPGFRAQAPSRGCGGVSPYATPRRSLGLRVSG